MHLSQSRLELFDQAFPLQFAAPTIGDVLVNDDCARNLSNGVLQGEGGVEDRFARPVEALDVNHLVHGRLALCDSSRCGPFVCGDPLAGFRPPAFVLPELRRADVPRTAPDQAASRVAVSDAACVVHDPHADRERFKNLREHVESR